MPGAMAERRGTCELYRIRKDGTGDERIADFSAERNEIYDVLPV